MQPQIDSLTEELQAQAERMSGEKTQALAEQQAAHAAELEMLTKKSEQYEADLSAETNKTVDLGMLIESQTEELVLLRDKLEAEEAKLKRAQLEKAEVQAKFDSARQDALRAFTDVERARAAQAQAEASAAETMSQLMDLEAVYFADLIPYYISIA
jgi:chromosome segregation ATPase